MNGIKTESIDHYGLAMGMIEELGIMDVIDKELPTKSESKIIPPDFTYPHYKKRVKAQKWG